MVVLSQRDIRRIRVLVGLGVTVFVALLVRLALFDFSASSEIFHPHGYCYLWRPDLVALHVVSDGLIGVSYVAISLTLIYLVWKARKHLPFSWIFVAFGAFIIACGLTHFMEIWTLWTPVFWLSADVKIVTAAASVATAVVLPPLIPKVLNIIEAAKLSEERRAALESAHAELETRVAERTEQLQAALARAEEASRLKEAFLSTVSHELRTPLNAILGWARMLNAPSVDDEFLRKGLAVIDRNARVQSQLVEDLLDVSRLGAGTLRLHLEPVDLSRVIADSIEVIRPAAEAKQVMLEISGDPHVPLMGDGRRLQQVVWNLLSNAVKFTPAGGTVAIRLARDEGRAVIEVRDTGIGIDREFMPLLFRRFSQADPTPTRSHQGLGLGLAIARQLTELHGGVITAESGGSGTGALFRVELPFRADVAVPERTEATADYGLARLMGVRALVVDDEPDAREILCVMLARAGARVTAADSVASALACLESDAYDVLLSDLAMPVRDGYSLIGEIRDSRNDRVRQMPAVAVSAYARDEDRQRAIERGFHLHVAKPVSPEELVNAVRALVVQ
jgi:signal transduction histidine kinase